MIIATGIARRTRRGERSQIMNAPSALPMKKVITTDSIISPSVQGRALAIRTDTGVGKVAVERPKSRVAMFAMYFAY